MNVLYVLEVVIEGNNIYTHITIRRDKQPDKSLSVQLNNINSCDVRDRWNWGSTIFMKLTQFFEVTSVTAVQYIYEAAIYISI